MKNDATATTAKPCPTTDYLRRKAEFEAQDKAGIAEGAKLAEEYLKGLPNNGY